MSYILFSPPPIIPPALKPYCYAWWDAGKTSLSDYTKWSDYSGNGRDMTLTNFAGTTADGWNPGKPSFLQTDGADSYGRYSATEINAVNTSSSLFCVFKVPNVTGSKYLALCDIGTSVGGVELYTSDATLRLLLADSVSGYVNVDKTIAANRIYMAIVSYDQSVKRGKLYLDGIYQGETSALSNGIKQITRIKTGINTGENAYSAESVCALSCFPGKALSDSEQYQIFKNNRRRFGI